jgi:hypothetical protein
MVAATLRRIAAFALARTSRTGCGRIATPGLVAAIPDAHAGYRPAV